MKKIITVIITIAMAVPQQAFALRPMATSKHDNASIMVKGRMDEFVEALERYDINITDFHEHPPAMIKISDDTLRDGLQNQEIVLDTDDKKWLDGGIRLSGVNGGEAGSFVSTKAYKTMADSKEFAAYCFQKHCEDPFSMLMRWLIYNIKYCKDLIAALKSAPRALSKIAVSVQTAGNFQYVVDNLNVTDPDEIKQIKSDILKAFRDKTVPALEMIRAWEEEEEGREVEKHGYISNVPRYQKVETDENVLLEIISEFNKQGITMIWLSDTTGEAKPDDVRRISKFVLELSKKPEFANLTFGWHIHDDGLGLVNMLAAVAEGITWFDTCLGGIGGSKAAVGASANASTEDWVALLQVLGVKVSADLDKLLDVTSKLEEMLDKDLTQESHLWGLHKLTPDERIEALAYLKSKLGLDSEAEKAEGATEQDVQLERHFETCA